MAGLIPPDFIQDLIARSDIVDVIDSRVKLKKAGRNYQACCPFHNEKTPSFSVSPDKQFYYCFGCGAKGNVISFLMEYDRLDFVEAVEDLAQLHGLEVPREKGNKHNLNSNEKAQRILDYELNQRVAVFYEQQLKSHHNSQKAIEYLKNRGLSGKIVKQWGIGFAPPEWQEVLNKFGVNENEQARLIALKLVNQNEKQRRYDFFRNRIMFPIKDKRGRVVAFGGRVIDNEDGPKYLNSPETRIFHKSNELYGFYEARQAHRHLERILVVEGYMDVVALSQFDINYAVASLGTATTPEHIQMMLKASDEIVCCYDGDRAGKQAAWRALENALPYIDDGKTVKFMFLPDGDDPDSMVRKVGKDDFEDMVMQAQPLSEFFFETLVKQYDIGSIEGKASLYKEASALIKLIKGQYQSTLMTNELDRRCGRTNIETNLNDSPSSESYQRFSNGDKNAQYRPPQKLELSPLRTMIRVLLSRPAIASEHPKANPSLLDPRKQKGLHILCEIHQYCMATPTANTGQLLEAFRNHQNIQHIERLLLSDFDEGIDLAAEYLSCFKALVRIEVDARIDELMAKGKLSISEEQELNLLSKQGR